MYRGLILWIALALLTSFQTFGEVGNYPIIITTLGSSTIYHYTSENFINAKNDFRINGNVAIHEDCLGEDSSRVYLTIGQRQFNYLLTPQTPIIRLTYDRDRRIFSGIGYNYLDHEGATLTLPRFKGHEISTLPSEWMTEINRKIADRTLLDQTEPTVFIIEAEIDECGIVQKVAELNGHLKQYSKVITDYFYDRAVRGWEPATRNGVPFKSIIHLKFELIR